MSDENQNNQNERFFDETYSIIYEKRRGKYKKYLRINVFICITIIILYKLRILRNIIGEEFMIFYIFFSMGIFHVAVIVEIIKKLNDLINMRTGEAKYLKQYYPDIWEKINPYGNITNNFEFRRFLRGKYIQKGTDPIIDRIIQERWKDLLGDINNFV